MLHGRTRMSSVCFNGGHTGFAKDPGGSLEFGLIGPEGKEQFDTFGDMVGVLCEAKVRIDLEVEMPPTHGGTSKYGRALRMIKPKGRRK